MEPALIALQKLYFQADARTGGQLSIKALKEIMESNADIGSAIHMTSLDALLTKKGEAISGTEYAQQIDGVGVVDLIGAIYPRANSMTSSGATSVTMFARDVERTYFNEDINAVLLRVDSPGGDVRNIYSAANTVWKLRQRSEKPIWAYVEGYGASAAYWIIAATERIVGEQNSVTGSIGVVLTGHKKDDGEIEIVSSVSPLKRPDPETEEGLAALKEQVNDIADNMVGNIAKFRGVSKEVILSDYGQGAVKIGPRALKQGMIDEIGELGATIEKLARAGKKRPSRNKTGSPGTTKTKALFAGALIDIGGEVMALKESLERLKALGEAATTAQASTPANEPDETDEGSTAATGAADINKTKDAMPTRAELEDTFADAGELFATQLVSGSKIFPAEAPNASLDLINAKVDDRLFGGTVSYCDENGVLQQGTREAAVRSKFNSSVKHNLADKNIKALQSGQVEGKILSEGKDEKVVVTETAPSRREALLNTTEAGRTVLREKQNSANGKGNNGYGK